MSEANGRQDLTLDDYLRPKPRTIRKLYVPALGGNAYLRSLKISEKEKWEAARLDQRGMSVKVNVEGTRASLLALTLCTPTGDLLGFTEDNVRALAEQDCGAVEQLYEASCEMNNLNRADVEALNRPNSVTTPAAASGAA